MDIVKKELQKFGESVSVKGITRILKARNVTLRLLWTIAVLASSGVLIWQITSVLGAYLEWSIETSYKQGDGPPEFPDVTICKLYTPDEGELPFEITYEDYLNITELKKKACPFDCFRQIINISLDYYNYIWSYIQSPSGYSQRSSKRSDGLFCKSLVRYTIYERWDWVVDDTVSHIKTFYDSSFKECCTIQINSASNRTEFKGFTVILYIDNFLSSLSNPSTFYASYLQGTGVRVAIHAPNALPALNNGISVGPGTEATVTLLNTIRQRVPYPYSGCTQQIHSDKMDDSSAMYTVDGCYTVCGQQSRIDRCNCVENDFYFSRRQLDLVNGRLCGITDVFNATIAEDFIQIACEFHDDRSQMIDEDFNDCISLCHIPCKENIYDFSVTSVPWPHPSVQLSFYQQYIATYEEFFGDKFKDYNQVVANDNYSVQEKNRLLKNLSTLEENFLSLNVVLGQSRPMLLTDAPSMTLDKMLSLIGGSLSLWLGITVMTAVEFLQFAFDMLMAIHGERKAKTVRFKERDRKSEEYNEEINIHL